MTGAPVHSTVHNLWKLARAHESMTTTGQPIVVGAAPAEQLAHLLVRDDGITLPEARTIVRALLFVAEPLPSCR